MNRTPRDDGSPGQVRHDDARISQADFSTRQRGVAVHTGTVDRPGKREVRLQPAGNRDSGCPHEWAHESKIEIARRENRGLSVLQSHLALERQRASLTGPLPGLDPCQTTFEPHARRLALRDGQPAGAHVEAIEADFAFDGGELARTACDGAAAFTDASTLPVSSPTAAWSTSPRSTEAVTPVARA